LTVRGELGAHDVAPPPHSFGPGDSSWLVTRCRAAVATSPSLLASSLH
jgi:hypothetical protein